MGMMILQSFAAHPYLLQLDFIRFGNVDPFGESYQEFAAEQFGPGRLETTAHSVEITEAPDYEQVQKLLKLITITKPGSRRSKQNDARHAN